MAKVKNVYGPILLILCLLNVKLTKRSEHVKFYRNLLKKNPITAQ